MCIYIYIYTYIYIFLYLYLYVIYIERERSIDTYFRLYTIHYIRYTIYI